MDQSRPKEKVNALPTEKEIAEILERYSKFDDVIELKKTVNIVSPDTRLKEKMDMLEMIKKNKLKTKSVTMGNINAFGFASMIAEDYESGFQHGRSLEDNAWNPPKTEKQRESIAAEMDEIKIEDENLQESQSTSVITPNKTTTTDIGINETIAIGKANLILRNTRTGGSIRSKKSALSRHSTIIENMEMNRSIKEIIATPEDQDEILQDSINDSEHMEQQNVSVSFSGVKGAPGITKFSTTSLRNEFDSSSLKLPVLQSPSGEKLTKKQHEEFETEYYPLSGNIRLINKVTPLPPIAEWLKSMKDDNPTPKNQSHWNHIDLTSMAEFGYTIYPNKPWQNPLPQSSSCYESTMLRFNVLKSDSSKTEQPEPSFITKMRTKFPIDRKREVNQIRKYWPTDLVEELGSLQNLITD